MKKDTIWITGAEGKLGNALVKAYKKSLQYTVIGTDRDVDITNMDEVQRSAKIYQPNIIINCAALSDSDYCETHLVEAFRVNAIGARNMATVARQHNAKIIHISTDDVFSGTESTPVTEFDQPTPVSVYGKSKLAGENYVKELTPKHVIIRTSWLYGAGEGDFFSYVKEMGEKNEEFFVPMDKVSAPTSATELVSFIMKIIDTNEYGTFHASCTGAISRQDFAKSILSHLGYDSRLAGGFLSGGQNQISYIVLENLMMQLTNCYEMPEWETALEAYIDAMKQE